MTALLVLGVALLALALIIERLVREGGRSDENDPRADDSGGGGNQRPKPPRPYGNGGGEPSWWPEFERQFAAYVAYDRPSAWT